MYRLKIEKVAPDHYLPHLYDKNVDIADNAPLRGLEAKDVTYYSLISNLTGGRTVLLPREECDSVSAMFSIGDKDFCVDKCVEQFFLQRLVDNMSEEYHRFLKEASMLRHRLSATSRTLEEKADKLIKITDALNDIRREMKKYE